MALPYPGRGHINPMLNLCKNLITRMDNITITFVVTEEWLSLLSSDPHPPSAIRYVSIPNVIPSELVRAQDIVAFIKAVQTNMAAPCDDLLRQMVLEQPLDFILADLCLSWPVEFGRRSNIPVVLFWPMSATVFSMFSHIDLLKSNGHFPIDLQAMADVQVDYIPGLTPSPLSAFPTTMYGGGLAVLDHCLEPFIVVSKSHCLLLCSVFDLEPCVVEAIKSEFNIPIYSVGPSFPHLRLREIANTDRVDDCLEWLTKQEPSSVLYVSFGSFCAISDEQMDELAMGLVQSGVKFLWVGRGDTTRLSEICRESDSLVVPWCDQLSVLSHIAVGGFLTHCGWSSTQEGLFTGMTFLTFPILMDQETNSKMIVDDFKVGWRLKGPTGVDCLVKRDEICVKAKRFMDSESSDVKEMRLRAKEMQNRCVKAVSDAEGSYEVNFSGFVDFISSHEVKRLNH